MGIKVEKVTSKEVCDCHKIEPGKPAKPDNLLCHRSNIIGWLSDEQEREYCSDYRVVPPERSEIDERIDIMQAWGKIADTAMEAETPKQFLKRVHKKSGEMLKT